MDIHTRWMSSLVKSMWQYGIDQWIGRNEYIYGKSKEEQQEKKNQEVDAQVRRIHQSNRNKVQQQDMHLFEMSVTKRLGQMLDRKKKGIECVNTAYEAWTEIQATKNRVNRPYAPLWNKNHGRRPHVRLRPTS